MTENQAWKYEKDEGLKRLLIRFSVSGLDGFDMWSIRIVQIWFEPSGIVWSRVKI